MQGTIRTPKQTGPPSWYSYYAGFSAAFAADALAYLGDQCGRGVVFDPWNGSGTTTTIAAMASFQTSIGFDINPALVMVARGRNVPVSFRTSLDPLAREILLAGRRLNSAGSIESGPLRRWFKPKAADALASLRHAIDTVLVDHHDVAAGSPVSELAAFYYTAAFHCVRDLLVRFRSTNPTWVKSPPSEQHRLSPNLTTVEGHFLRAVHLLANRLVLERAAVELPTIQQASSTDLPLPDNAADCCLTSPPYCTRIDYAVASRPELAFLGVDSEYFQHLRSASIGTTVTPRTFSSISSRSPTARKLLRDIAAHKSKAASTYYLRYFANYFGALEQSLAELDRVVKPTGSIAIVVQDSYFKDIHIDLQQYVAEILGETGRCERFRLDFNVPRNLARMNPFARPYSKPIKTQESLLIFS